MTDEGEIISLSSNADYCDKEGLLTTLQAHQEMLEFGLQYSVEDPVAYDIMQRNLKYKNGRYELPLLWRNDAVLLPNSYAMAIRRIEGLKRRLKRDSDLHTKYTAIISKGYAEAVPEGEIVSNKRKWYIPHHPVINPKKPDKVRIVYDCAAVVGSKSLNDFLMKAPDWTSSLVGVLLRFRKGKVAEVAIDLSTSSFINVLRRFVSRRGPVKHIFSDNGTNFVGCARLMQESVKRWNQAQIHQSLRQMNVAWTFNPPSASHMGGVWERMIRVVRNVLLAITPKQTLSDDDLVTLFTEVEAIVNSRPLTNVPLEAGEDTPLTPNHLLRLNPAVAPPCILTEESDNYSRQRFRIVQFAADEFWKRWVVEYSKTIQTRSKWHKTRRNFALGDIVLITNSSTPRCHWPLGKVSKLFPDNHGTVRTVSVKTSEGELKRPCCKLCLIMPYESE